MKRIGDLTIPKIASLYAQVPSAELAKFQAFRNDFPYNYLNLEGQAWAYLDGGRGDAPLLYLSGALAVPEIAWSSIAELSARHRIIVPAYPPIGTLDALVDGFATILRHEGLERVHVMGGSYGGAVAQVFLRRHPGMTLSLVLSHTQPPNLALARTLRRLAASLRWLPMFALRRLMRRTFGSLMPAWSDETACMLAVFEELIDYALDKRDAAAILERMADFSLRSFTPRDLKAWQGKILLIFGEEDPATPLRLRQRLLALYPGALLRIFEGTGRESSVNQSEEYLKVVESFLTSA